MSGRTVKIFLVDGDPNGMISVEIMNWTGQLIVAPRSQLAQLSKREGIKRSGVYFLTGSNPKDPAQEKVYIGESDNIWTRLILHNKDADKEFWEKTIIITSKDENLTKAHVRYLESRLIQIANQVKRAAVINNTHPDNTNLPEPDIADMEYFLDQIRLILPVLGFTFINPLPSVKEIQRQATDRFASPVFIMNYSGAEAKAQEINGEFVVLEGSFARKSHTKSLADSYLRIRQRLVENGQLTDIAKEDYWIFAQNVPFQSPSTAANIVGGASLNGRQHWKVEGTNQTYARWSEEQVKTAEQVLVNEEELEH